MINHFVLSLKGRMQKKIDQISNDLSSGCAKDFTDYKRLTAKIETLRFCINEAIDLMKQYDEEDFDV